MSYNDATFKGHAYREPLTDDGDDFDISVHFSGQTGYDMHPYGSTYARQDWSEVHDVIEVVINGEPVSLQYLDETFGKDEAKKIIAQAESNAEKDE